MCCIIESLNFMYITSIQKLNKSCCFLDMYLPTRKVFVVDFPTEVQEDVKHDDTKDKCNVR